MEGWQEVQLAGSNKVLGARAGFRQFSPTRDGQCDAVGTLTISAASLVADPKFHQQEAYKDRGHLPTPKSESLSIIQSLRLRSWSQIKPGATFMRANGRNRQIVYISYT